MKPSRLVRACLLGAALTLLPALAQSENVVARVLVLRHGVRSPTSPPDELAPYASRPWATWPVAPGMLTEHGAQGIAALGQRLRRMLAADGLGHGECGDPWLVIADSTPRNRASGAALARGLQPSCGAAYLALAPEQNNPLFHFVGKSGATKDDVAVAPAAWPPSALAELQSVLLGCDGDSCVQDARRQGRQLLLNPARDDRAAHAKTLKAAGSLSENLMLEYAQGFAPSQVAWGSGDAATLGRLIGLHNEQFALSKKSMPTAARSASNLMAHIMATLQQAAGKRGDVAPLASANTRTVLLVGHDTNLANLAGLLELDWHDPRQPDDYPPGGALVFDLLKRKDSYALRVSSWMPTLAALRQADFADDGALLRHTLPLAPCHGQDSCPLGTLTPWLAGRMDAASIDPAIPAMPVNRP